MKKDMVKSVVVLTAIALVSGVLLGLFHQLTALTADEEEARVLEKLAEVVELRDPQKVDRMGADDEGVRYFYRDTDAAGEEYYILVTEGEGGYGGPVEMFVLVQHDRIFRLAVGSNAETPSKLEQILNESYLAQYLDKDITAIGEFVLNGGGENGVDAVVSVTRSATAVNNAVNAAVRFYTAWKEA